MSAARTTWNELRGDSRRTEARIALLTSMRVLL